ncbi:MAG: hypothetical protein GTN40_05185 [Candidatus Aenigmarchaeota archaeon]|nr:hypothetical protein [Candidatus Aenigmarchaeota archaeon]
MFICEYKCQNCGARFRKITDDKSVLVVCPGCGDKNNQLTANKEIETDCNSCSQCPGCH